MARFYTFHLTGATCGSCLNAVGTALKSNPNKQFICSTSMDDSGKYLLNIKPTEPRLGYTDVMAYAAPILNDMSMDYLPPEDDSDTNAEIIIENQAAGIVPKKIRVKKNSMRLRIIKGIVGIALGVGLMAVTLSGAVIPFAGMCAIVGVGSALTLALGFSSYREAFKKIKSGKMTMDTLFTVSTLAVIGASIASLFVPGLPMMIESGLLIFGFHDIGQAIELSIKKKVLAGLAFKDREAKSVLGHVENSDLNTWEEISIDAIKTGQRIRVKSGDTIPVDGTAEMNSLVYKTMITGSIEPSPVKKGEVLLAGMKVPDDITYIELTVKELPGNSYLARQDERIKFTNRAGQEAPIETTANKILQFFVPAVLALSAISGVIVGLLSTPVLAIQCAVSVLASACPCTLGFITGSAVKLGYSKALENGVKFSSSKDLQNANKVDTVVFDLNGTLTTGIPEVVDYQIYANSRLSPKDFLQRLAAIEGCCDHATAKAIYSFVCGKYREMDIFVLENVNKKNHSGISATIDNELHLIGNLDFLKAHGIELPEHSIETNVAEQVVYFVVGGRIMGHIKLKDPLRKDAKFTVDELKRQGKEVHICTGADQKTAEQYAAELNIPVENIYANCIGHSDDPEDRTKIAYIEFLKKQGKRICMVGDGGNDAPAMAESVFSIAIKSESSDPSTQAEASAVVESNSLLPVVSTFAISKMTMAAIKQNLVMSLVYNMAILVVTGSLLVAIGFALNPGIGVALMVVQTVLILANLYRIRKQHLEHVKRFELEMQRQRLACDTSSYKQLESNGLTKDKSLQAEADANITKSVAPEPKKTITQKLQKKIHGFLMHFKPKPSNKLRKHSPLPSSSRRSSRSVAH